MASDLHRPPSPSCSAYDAKSTLPDSSSMLGSAFEDQLRAEVLALRSELRHARAQTNTLESKLVRATKRNPAPFGSSQPTIGTHAHFELHEGQQSPTGVSFGRSPPASIPARPRSAMADYSGASTRILSPSPESSSFTPNGRTQVPQPPTRSSSLQDQVEAGSPSTTPVHGKTLSRIPFAAVGAGRALAGIEHDGRRMSPRSPRSPPTLQHEEDMLAPVVGAVDLADHLAPAFVLNEAPVIPNGTSDPTASGEPSSGLTSATRHVHRSANSPLAASGAGSPFFGSSSTGDRHAARLLSSSTGTGRVLSSLQADLASLRTQLDSTKAQLRISQRAVESLGRQAEEARDARDRIRAEADATMARLTRRERQFEDLLSRAQRAEAELNASRERERDAVTHAKSLEAGTADAKTRAIRAESTYDALASSVSRMRDTWRGEATALREQFESLRTGYGKDLDEAKLRHQTGRPVVKLFQSRASVLADVQSALSGRSQLETRYASQLASLSADVATSVRASDESVQRSQDVEGELRRLRRLMREHAETLPP